MRILFIQGGGAGTHDEWDDQLVDDLRRRLEAGYEVRYPRMPNEDDPSVASWGPAIQRELASLADGDVVVGHSVGGTLLIHLLTETSTPTAFAAVVLISAPFVGDGGWPGDEFELPSDLGSRLPPGLAVHVVHGLADETAPPSHAERYAQAVPQAHLLLLPGRDHQLSNDLSEVAELIRATPERHIGNR